MAIVLPETQNTPEWLARRQLSIGGSDANLIAAWFLPGYDWPFGSWAGAELYRLWAQKTGRIPIKERQDKSYGDFVDPLTHGHREEEKARAWYNEQYGEFISPEFIQHDIMERMTASLDGWVRGTAIVEIKCPKEPDSHRKAKEGEVPGQYWAQLHHNMTAAGTPLCHYVSFYKGEGVVIPVEMDVKFQAELMAAEDTFWGWVVEKKFPLVLSGEVAGYQNKELAKALEEYWEYQKAIRALELEERQLKKRIAKLLPVQKVKGCGARISLSVRAAQDVPSFHKNEYISLTIERE